MICTNVIFSIQYVDMCWNLEPHHITFNISTLALHKRFKKTCSKQDTTEGGFLVSNFSKVVMSTCKLEFFIDSCDKKSVLFPISSIMELVSRIKGFFFSWNKRVPEPCKPWVHYDDRHCSQQLLITLHSHSHYCGSIWEDDEHCFFSFSEQEACLSDWAFSVLV